MRRPQVAETVQLDEQQLRTAIADGQLDSAMTNGADLAETRAEPLELVDVQLTETELSNARWRRLLARRVELLDCRAIGLRLDLERVTDLRAVRCRFDYAHLHIEQAKGPVRFEGCSMRETVITGDLRTTVFDDCLLAGTEFRAERATGCDLRGCDISAIRGLLSLRGAVLEAPQVFAAAVPIARAAGLDVRE